MLHVTLRVCLGASMVREFMLSTFFLRIFILVARDYTFPLSQSIFPPSRKVRVTHFVLRCGGRQHPGPKGLTSTGGASASVWTHQAALASCVAVPALGTATPPQSSPNRR